MNAHTRMIVPGRQLKAEVFTYSSELVRMRHIQGSVKTANHDKQKQKKQQRLIIIKKVLMKKKMHALYP